jgi:hypothetical protein
VLDFSALVCQLLQVLTPVQYSVPLNGWHVHLCIHTDVVYSASGCCVQLLLAMALA